MAAILSFLISSGSKKKEPRCACLSEAKGHTFTPSLTEVSSTLPIVWLLHSPNTYKCLLKLLCPLSRPITTLDCVLLKDNNLALLASLGPSLSLCNTRTTPQYQVLVIHPAFYLTFFFCLETPKKGSGPANLSPEPSLASLSA
jgi:hypothetical protein